MRIIALSLLAIVLLLQYKLWISDSGMREVWRLRHEVAEQQETNAQLKDRNRTLAAEVQDLKKGKSAVEERARTDLGMVGSNETFFQVAKRGSDATPTSDTLTAQQSVSDAGTAHVQANQPSNKPADATPLVGTHAATP